jgi:hypothetical protein
MSLTQYICNNCGAILRGGLGDGHKEGCAKAQYEIEKRIMPGDYKISKVCVYEREQYQAAIQIEVEAVERLRELVRNNIGRG